MNSPADFFRQAHVEKKATQRVKAWSGRALPISGEVADVGSRQLWSWLLRARA
jgi:hypothetical protein